jgi:hypothetical protein
MQYCYAVQACLQEIRGVSVPAPTAQGRLLETTAHFCQTLRTSGHTKEADALDQALWKCQQPIEYGGLGYDPNSALSNSEEAEVLFQIEAHLCAIKAREQGWRRPVPLLSKNAETKPMTLAQKIFAHHAIGATPLEGLHLGDVARVAVDWIMASELSYLVSTFG